MNRDEIKKILPHREPMLLVDEVNLNEDGSATGFCTVRGDEFFLQGHFPENPIVPGVILCEMMAQASCAMFTDLMAKENAIPVYTGLDKVKFRKQVKPGDTVEIHTEIIKSRHPFYSMKGELFVGGKRCMNGEFSFMIVNPDGHNAG